MPSHQIAAVRADRNFARQADGQLLFLISPDRDHQRKRNTPKHCRHQHAEEVSVEFQIDQRAWQDQCRSRIPASWHTAISVSLFIGTDAPKSLQKPGGPLRPVPPRRNATPHSLQG